MKTAPDYWYNNKLKVPLSARLLSRVYEFVSQSRRRHFRTHQQSVFKSPVPLIVVGNITAGGTGKTPLVIALAEFLQQQGFIPGIISRGYGGKGATHPQSVTVQSNPQIVGDEPVLIANRTSLPVVVDPKRKRGIEFLLEENPAINVIISDDGLQHYAMGRDIEIAVIDGDRRFGNEMLLPAGPLREKISRLAEVDFCITNGSAQNSGEFAMALQLHNARSLVTGEVVSLQVFNSSKVHAVAGIGNPQRFFNALQQQGIALIPHAYPDHYQFQKNDLCFTDNLPVLITEKDAVKCTHFKLNNVWVVPVTTVLPESFFKQLLEKLRNIKKG